MTATEGIVLRSVKYGDTSLVTTIFTRIWGVQSYLVQGVRNAKTKGNKAAMLQPATLLDIVTENKSGSHLQRMKDYQFAYLYQDLQQDVVKNTIALFSAELLLRLLPEHADQPDLFDFCSYYFRQMDVLPTAAIANFPLYFIIQCGRSLGYYVHGNYTEATPYLNMADGAFSRQADTAYAGTGSEHALLVHMVSNAKDLTNLREISMSSKDRHMLLDWYIGFLKMHTQHLGTIRSLPVLQAILH